jgi:hypothetical protein
MTRSAPRSGFTPRVKGVIIRAVGKQGEYRGRRGKQEFAIYRGLDGVILLVAEGKRWRTMPAANVWDACEVVDQILRSARYQEEPVDADTDNEISRDCVLRGRCEEPAPRKVQTRARVRQAVRRRVPRPAKSQVLR